MPIPKTSVRVLENEDIRHRGVVFNISGRRIDVAVKPEEACGACKAKSVCAVGNEGERIVSVMSEVPAMYSVGEEVEVSTGKAMGIKAVVYAYIFPFFIMFVLLLGLVEFGASEPVAGLSALGAVAVYYIVLSFFRKKVERTIIFKIHKIYE